MILTKVPQMNNLLQLINLVLNVALVCVGEAGKRCAVLEHELLGGVKICGNNAGHVLIHIEAVECGPRLGHVKALLHPSHFVLLVKLNSYRIADSHSVAVKITYLGVVRLV